MEALSNFKERFRFNPDRAFMVGIERECFVTDGDGRILPRAPAVIAHVQKHGWQAGALPQRTEAGDMLGYELSACQIETRTIPCHERDLDQALALPDTGLRNTMRELDLYPLYTEVVPDDMPLDVYPDPTGRYQQITAKMSREVLLAACQVAGTHVHIGMPDHETALRVYNRAVKHCQQLCRAGDQSHGKRLAIYDKVAKRREPAPYSSWPAFLDVACAEGFEENPRDCWTLIRISIHGTIEFRMFGSTPSLKQIAVWARQCHSICRSAV